MEHNGAARQTGDTPASDASESPELAAAIATTVADLGRLRDEELPIPDDVQDRIQRTIADLTRH